MLSAPLPLLQTHAKKKRIRERKRKRKKKDKEKGKRVTNLGHKSTFHVFKDASEMLFTEIKSNMKRKTQSKP